jgi:hypothetical protein
MKIGITKTGYFVQFPSPQGRYTKTFKTIIETLDFAAWVSPEYMTEIPQSIRDYLEVNYHRIEGNGGMHDFIRIQKRPRPMLS